MKDLPKRARRLATIGLLVAAATLATPGARADVISGHTTDSTYYDGVIRGYDSGITYDPSVGTGVTRSVCGDTSQVLGPAVGFGYRYMRVSQFSYCSSRDIHVAQPYITKYNGDYVTWRSIIWSWDGSGTRELASNRPTQVLYTYQSYPHGGHQVFTLSGQGWFRVSVEVRWWDYNGRYVGSVHEWATAWYHSGTGQILL